MSPDNTNADAGNPKRIRQDQERRLRKIERQIGWAWGALAIIALQNPELLKYLVKMIVK